MKPARLIAFVGAAALLAACQHGGLPTGSARSQVPIQSSTLALMASKGVSQSDPILIRAYKKEAEMEVWKKARDGRFVHLKTFPICRWSGQLGPKTRQGDRQVPEGFYAITPKQMNPNSAYYLSFDIGYPNAYDRAHGGSGAYLMVHGTCSSAGCFAMTDQGVAEIYALAREAFAGGQQAFQFQSYPFRMTAENMAKYRTDPNIGFWRQLKEGSDRFEATRDEPSVGVSDGRYVFGPTRDPAKEARAKARIAEEKAQIEALVRDGAAAVRTTYADGGQHPSFGAKLKLGAVLGQVSRPEALAFAGREVVLIPARRKKPTQVADAKPGSSLKSLLQPVAWTPRRTRPNPVAEIDPAAFAPKPVNDGPTWPMAFQAAMPGSARILPTRLGTL